MSEFTLATLEAIIVERANAPADQSYTAALVAKGMPRAAKKLGEEAVEAVIAALDDNKAELVGESADVLYHLMVVLHMKGIAIEDVLAELARRTAQSGHQEKASRPAGGA